MRIKMLKSGRIRNENDSYAARLIEQGKAVALAQTEQPKAKEEKPHGA